jgi:hypothetical protein
MRVKSGVVGLSLMMLSALVASSANTRTAEARSSAVTELDARVSATLAHSRASLPADASARAGAEPSALRLEPVPHEVVTPPPADLRLENPKLRRMQKGEITPAMLTLAGSLVRRYHTKPVGTQVEVDVGGKRVIARIERHFHPEGGPVKPWGYHPGVSLFVAR